MCNKINGKSPEDIKKGLESCHESHVEGCIDCSKCPYGYVAKCKDVLHADALALIQRPEAAQPQWISVEDRLPERGFKVLTVNGHGYIRIFALWKRTEREWCWINDAGHFNHCNDITHWMPLPEAPKEE